MTYYFASISENLLGQGFMSKYLILRVSFKCNSFAIHGGLKRMNLLSFVLLFLDYSSLLCEYVYIRT